MVEPIQVPPASDKQRIEDMVGRTLEGRYRVDGVIGYGGTAWVLAVQHLELDVGMALKILRQRHSNNDHTYAHFVQEARLLFRLRHPNIVRVYDALRLKAADAFVMERLDGKSLWFECHERPMPWRQACTHLLECCSAVEALHTAGFVHRDLNPNNFILARPLDEPEAIKLIDLGLARNLPGEAPLADDLEAVTTGIIGTPAFIAPEVARGEVRHSIAADTYGLVVTFYLMVTGQPPFRGSPEAMLHAIATTMPDIPVWLPAPVRALLTKGLAKDPAERYQAPAELAGAVSRLLRAEEAPVVPLPQAAGPRRRWPLAAGLATAVAGLALALGLSIDAQPEAGALVVVDDLPAPATWWPPTLGLRERSTTRAAEAAEAPLAKTDPVSLEEQLAARLPALRGCADAPRGPVLLELSGGLRRIDLGELDPDDKWHACAARVLRRVRGRGRVDVAL